MNLAARYVVLVALFACSVTSSAWSDEFTETPASFPLAVGGDTLRLEGLIVKKSDAQGRQPIALLINGGATTATGGASATAAAYAHYARDLARRGWLAIVVMRRGFGKSEGAKPSPVGCQAASFDAWASAAGDDLQAAIDSVSQRADADPGKVIVIGSEIAGVAAVALSARNPHGLLGVISVSGGLQSESNCPMSEILVEGYRKFGTKSRVPNLWLYSNADKIFDPDLADRLHTVFLDSGGDVKFISLFHEGNVGTPIFGQAAAAWFVQMDGFLRARNLPTWTMADIKEVIDRLKITDRLEKENLEGYLAQHYFSAPGEKAIAFSPAVQDAWVRPQNKVFAEPRLPVTHQTNSRTIDEARAGALAACQRIAQDCVIVMENLRWTGDVR